MTKENVLLIIIFYPWWLGNEKQTLHWTWKQGKLGSNIFNCRGPLPRLYWFHVLTTSVKSPWETLLKLITSKTCMFLLFGLWGWVEAVMSPLGMCNCIFFLGYVHSDCGREWESPGMTFTAMMGEAGPLCWASSISLLPSWVSSSDLSTHLQWPVLHVAISAGQTLRLVLARCWGHAASQSRLQHQGLSRRTVPAGWEGRREHQNTEKRYWGASRRRWNSGSQEEGSEKEDILVERILCWNIWDNVEFSFCYPALSSRWTTLPAPSRFPGIHG